MFLDAVHTTSLSHEIYVWVGKEAVDLALGLSSSALNPKLNLASPRQRARK